MLDQEYISKEQYDECLADNVYERIQQVAQQQQEDENKVYSYFIDELTEQVVKDLQEQRGYTESQAYNALYSGGLRIYTTQAVSYTHLDVYKRQGICLPSQARFPLFTPL